MYVRKMILKVGLATPKVSEAFKLMKDDNGAWLSMRPRRQHMSTKTSTLTNAKTKATEGVKQKKKIDNF